MDAPTRRQNRSCDRCRRSKRRCILESGRSQQCRNCARLGDKCTFTLAATIAAKKQQWSSRNTASGLAESAIPVDLDSDTASADATERTVSLAHGTFSPIFQENFENIWSPPSLTSIPFCFDNLFSELLDGPPGIENVFGPEEAMHISLSDEDEFPVSSHPLRPDGNQTSHAQGTPDGVLSRTASVNSPRSLLTSTLDSILVNEYLDRFFHALTTVLYHRYLNPRTNLSVREPLYEILPDASSDNLLASANNKGLDQSIKDQRTSRSMGQLQESSDIVKISVIGAARFLDNFALLYGNHRARGQREQDEETLRLVVQAVAINHSPLSTENGQQTDEQAKLIADSWFSAYRSLVESNSRRSFVLEYALFTFDLASAVPEILAAENPDIDTISLLDHALRQLDHLSTLVQNLCSRLSDHSFYKKKLQTCLRMILWHGWVRDTVCSFRVHRPCVVEDIPLNSIDSQNLTIPACDNDLVALDRDIPSICERAFGWSFAAYRLIATMQTKSAIHETVDLVSIGQHVSSLIGLVRSFECTYGTWVQVCLDRFLQLSTKSQLSLGFLVIFWNVAILRFYDVVNDIHTMLALDSDDLRIITAHRSRAVLAFAIMAGLIFSISESSDLPVLDHDGVKLAFVAHHANSALMAFALETAIRHTIELRQDESTRQDSERKGALKPLVWCLLSMERTNAGRTVARPAFDRLVSNYGDAILESWTPEND